MQDKRIQIDEKFTDRAWSEMSLLLDRDMPLPPARRRPFPWWWGAVFAGIVMLVGAGFLFFGKKLAATTAVSSQPVAGAISEEPIEQQSFSNPSVLRTDLASEAHENANSNLANQQESLTKTNGKPAAGQKLLPQNHAQILVEEEGQRSVFYSEENKVAASSGLPNDTEVALLPASILPQKTIAPALLEAVDIETISLDESPAPAVSAKIIAPISPRWGFAMEGAGMAAITKPGSGASISAIAVRPLKNSKVSIETGFGYSILQQPLSVVVDGASAPVFEGSGSMVNANYGLQENLASRRRQHRGCHFLPSSFETPLRPGATQGNLPGASPNRVDDGIGGRGVAFI